MLSSDTKTRLEFQNILVATDILTFFRKTLYLGSALSRSGCCPACHASLRAAQIVACVQTTRAALAGGEDVTAVTFVLPLVIFGSMIVIGIAVAIRKTGRRAIRPASDDQPFTVLSLPQAFDPDYTIIWDTQVPALELILRAGPSGLPIRRLRAWYRDSARHYPELYDGSSFARWMEFFEGEQIVKATGGKALVTAGGQLFLECRVAALLSVTGDPR